MMMDDDGQMIFGDLGGIKLPDMSYRWWKTPKKPHPGNLLPFSIVGVAIIPSGGLSKTSWLRCHWVNDNVGKLIDLKEQGQSYEFQNPTRWHLTKFIIKPP